MLCSKVPHTVQFGADKASQTTKRWFIISIDRYYSNMVYKALLTSECMHLGKHKLTWHDAEIETVIVIFKISVLLIFHLVFYNGVPSTSNPRAQLNSSCP